MNPTLLTSSNNNDVANNSALPVPNVDNSSDSTIPVIRVSEMKSFLYNINSVEGLSQLQVEKLTKLMKPFAADVPQSSMHILLMLRRISSLITNPIVPEHGVLMWSNAVTPSDFYRPLQLTNLVKK